MKPCETRQPFQPEIRSHQVIHQSFLLLWVRVSLACRQLSRLLLLLLLLENVPRYLTYSATGFLVSNHSHQARSLARNLNMFGLVSSWLSVSPKGEEGSGSGAKTHLLSASASHPPSKTTQSSLSSRAVSVPSTHSCSPTCPSPSSKSRDTLSPGPGPQQQYRPLLPKPTSLPTISQTVSNLDDKGHRTATATKKRRLNVEKRRTGSPQKEKRRRQKYSASETKKIGSLRGSGMKWEDIGKELDHSAHSCRTHLRAYVKDLSGWDDGRRTHLAREYERYVITSSFDDHYQWDWYATTQHWHF